MQPGESEEFLGGVAPLRQDMAHLVLPGLVDPLDHGKRQVFFAGKLMVEGATAVTRLPGYVLKRQASVAVLGDALGGGLEDGVAALSASVGLGSPFLLGGHARPGLRRTYVHASYRLGTDCGARSPRTMKAPARAIAQIGEAGRTIPADTA